jgi:hypothetical protein
MKKSFWTNDERTVTIDVSKIRYIIGTFVYLNKKENNFVELDTKEEVEDLRHFLDIFTD